MPRRSRFNQRGNASWTDWRRAARAVGVARRLVGFCCGGFSQRPHRACTSPIVGAAAGQDDQGTSRVSDDAERLYSCATCTLFVPPNLCKVVEGEVSPDGWRKAFALAD
jgi:hypothetical protein